VKPILLYPTGTDAHGRIQYSGTQFKDLFDLHQFQLNGRDVTFKHAIVLSNGVSYDANYDGIHQALADAA
jgi:hypothetical protein